MPASADRLAMFIPLAKADAARRLVYGHFDETPDRAGEICDYPSARPAFEAWSAELEKASDGKSLGKYGRLTPDQIRANKGAFVKMLREAHREFALKRRP